jgi:hypothetical protein
MHLKNHIAAAGIQTTYYTPVPCSRETDASVLQTKFKEKIDSNGGIRTFDHENFRAGKQILQTFQRFDMHSI